MNRFLTETGGITCTSANYLCNISAELAKEKLNQISDISFIDTNLQIITNSKSIPARKGITTLENIPTLLKEVAELYTFNAWFRKAIEAYNENKKFVSQLTFAEYCQLKNIIIPALPKAPIKVDVYSSETDYLSMGQYLDYLAAETTAAVYGKQIHPDGSIATARNEFQKSASNPASYTLNGQNTVVITKSPSVSKIDVENLFFQLQAFQRASDKAKNSLLAIAKDMQSIDRRNKYSDFQQAYDEYESQCQEIQNITNKRKEEYQQYLADEIEKASKLHLLLPERFKSLYDKLNSIK